MFSEMEPEIEKWTDIHGNIEMDHYIFDRGNARLLHSYITNLIDLLISTSLTPLSCFFKI